MLLICSNTQIDVLYPLSPLKPWEYVVSELNISQPNKRKQSIPMSLVGLTALLSVGLSVATAYLQKDRIETNLLQKARQALSAADLPPVNIAFEGRAATLTGSVADDSLAEDVITTVRNVFGVRKVSSELEAQPVELAEPLLELFEPEFENGLYIPPRFHPLEKYNLSAVQFAYSTATLTEESLPVLEQLAVLLKQNAQIQVELSVHTDNQGTALGQMTVTELRADKLREYMLSQGVLPEQLLTTGYGATRPVARNDTTEGRAKNRRVEIAVLKDG